ncbi:MAG: DUF3883 domain-containing protein [Actinomycetota bacterium]
MGRRDWDQTEIDATVDAYFRLLKAELAESPLKKSVENERVRQTVNRSKGAVEYKFQNVSAVMRDLHLYWVEGYKPAKNYQGALRDAVVNHLETDPTIEEFMLQRVDAPVDQQIPADFHWNLTSPPSIPLAPRPDKRVRRAVKRDYVALEAQRRDLGLAGEVAVLNWERERLERTGHPRLARNVRHVSVTEGDGLGYDILSFDPAGDEKFIEVKTTRQGVEWPFLVSRNEVEFSAETSDRFNLYRVFDFGKLSRSMGQRDLGLYVLPGSLEQSCSLQPEVYQGLPR